MIFAKKKKKILVWCDDPPEDRVISMVAGSLANHDRAHSHQIFVIDSSVACKAFVTLAADTKDDDLDPQSLGLKGDYCRTNPLAWRLTQLLERMGLI